MSQPEASAASATAIGTRVWTAVNSGRLFGEGKARITRQAEAWTACPDQKNGICLQVSTMLDAAAHEDQALA